MVMLHRLENLVCSHCKAVADQSILFAKAERKLHREHNGQSHWIPTDRLRAFLLCQHCGQPSMMVMTPRDQVQMQKLTRDAQVHEEYLNLLRVVDVVYEGSNQNHRGLQVSSNRIEGHRVLSMYQISEWFPTTDIQRPERQFLPDEVNQAFDELEGVLSQPRHSVIACRRILEISCAKSLETPKETLDQKLGQLHASGQLTKEVFQWAKALKNILNGKTHEDEAPSASTAKEVYDFTRLLVELLFVYPKKIESLKQSH